MSRVIGWFRRLIDEPDDFCLDGILRPQVNPNGGSTRAIAFDLARFDEHAEAASS